MLLTSEPFVVSPPQSNLRIRFTRYNWDPRPCPAPYLTTGCLREVRLTIPPCTLAGWPRLPSMAFPTLQVFFSRPRCLCGLLTQLFVPGLVCLHMHSTHDGPGSESLPAEGSACSWDPAPRAQCFK